MTISEENPPHHIRELCEERFDLTSVKPLFTYGDTLYNPHKMPIDEALLAHEMTHTEQQKSSPANWWTRYFEDDEFRFAQEAQAYAVQYRFAEKKIKDRNALFRYARALAKSLSSGLYGNLASTSECLKIIRNK